MTLEIIDVEQGSSAWLQARAGLLTASVIGRLITPSRLQVASNDTARGIIHELVAERITGIVEDAPMTSAMMRGVWDEPIARAAYEEHYAPVREVGFMVRTIDGNRLGYSPDGLVGDDGIIEIKSRKPRHQLDTILNNTVPTYYMAQIQTGLLVTGRSWCDFISYSGGMPLYVKRVHPDEGWQTAITNTLDHFETKATETITAYETATAHLHPTERHAFDTVSDLEF